MLVNFFFDWLAPHCQNQVGLPRTYICIGSGSTRFWKLPSEDFALFLTPARRNVHDANHPSPLRPKGPAGPQIFRTMFSWCSHQNVTRQPDLTTRPENSFPTFCSPRVDEWVRTGAVLSFLLVRLDSGGTQWAPAAGEHLLQPMLRDVFHSLIGGVEFLWPGPVWTLSFDVWCQQKHCPVLSGGDGCGPC